MTDDISKILTDADHPRPPTSDELTRIRASVFGAQSGDQLRFTRQGNTDDHPTIIPLTAAAGRRPISRRRPIAAAILLLIAGAAGLYLAVGLETASEIATSSPPPPACDAIPAITDALEAWRDVETWAQLSVTNPDLGQAALDAVRLLDDSPERTQAIADLEAIAARTNEGRNVEARRSAVVTGLQLVVLELEQYDHPQHCALDELRPHLP